MNFFFLDHLLSAFSPDVGIDLGTANTPIKIRGRKTVYSEPSYVTIDNHTHKVVAVGNEAKLMEGKTPPHLSVIRPIRDGAIAEFDIAGELMKYLLRRVNRQGFLRPRVIVAVSSDTTEVERRAVAEASKTAGARVVYLLEQPLAAAIGADLEVLKPRGNMILDIGGGTSEVALVSLGGVVLSHSIKLAGDKMDEAIVQYLRHKYDLLIGLRTAEELKIEIGTAFPMDDGRISPVRGRDLRSGLPRTVDIRSDELAEALSGIIKKVLEMIKHALENTPPELISDMVSQGMVLTGGGSLLRGLDSFLSHQLGIRCYRAPDPLLSVVLGEEKLFQDKELMRLIPLERY